MYDRLLAKFYARTVTKGSLEVTYASGQTEVYGDGTGETVKVRYKDKRAERGFVLNPVLRFGELYMDGTFAIDQGTLYDFVVLMKRNGFRRYLPGYIKAITAFNFVSDRIKNLWRAEAEKRMVAHHYDLDAKLYQMFLDEDWQYTCAYYEREDMTLEEAQLAKKRHVTAKLLVKPGNKVLEMGCGWGGLALYIAELTGVHVTAVTLSEQQVQIAQTRAKTRKLEDLTDFRLQNYRDVTGTFDRIISIGMLEHVGRQNFDVMFEKAYGLLDKHGVMVVHAIGRPKPALTQTPFNEKYIFPGGHVPAVSEIATAIEKAGFLIKDLEILPMHYARTCREWRERFMTHWDEAAELYDEEFCRMWEMYLATSESAFAHDRLMIFQFQLAKHQDVVPFTRDYLATEKSRLMQLEDERMTVDKVEL